MQIKSNVGLFLDGVMFWSNSSTTMKYIANAEDDLGHL